MKFARKGPERTPARCSPGRDRSFYHRHAAALIPPARSPGTPSPRSRFCEPFELESVVLLESAVLIEPPEQEQRILCGKVLAHAGRVSGCFYELALGGEDVSARSPGSAVSILKAGVRPHESFRALARSKSHRAPLELPRRLVRLSLETGTRGPARLQVVAGPRNRANTSRPQWLMKSACAERRTLVN